MYFLVDPKTKETVRQTSDLGAAKWARRVTGCLIFKLDQNNNFKEVK